MIWPWKRTDETQSKIVEAEAQAAEAEHEYEKTVETQNRVAEVLAMFFYHAEKNRIIENLHKVARGH